MSIPEGSAIITPAKMYEELQEVHRAVDTLTATIGPAVKNVADDVKDHESRLRSLERKVWGLAGAATLLGAAAGVSASVLASH